MLAVLEANHSTLLSALNTKERARNEDTPKKVLRDTYPRHARALGVRTSRSNLPALLPTRIRRRAMGGSARL